MDGAAAMSRPSWGEVGPGPGSRSAVCPSDVSPAPGTILHRPRCRKSHWGGNPEGPGGALGRLRDSRSASGARTAMPPAPFNARTRVHEYGGGAVTLAGGVAA